MHKGDKRDFDAAAATWDEDPRRLRLAQEVVAAIVRELPLSSHMEALDYGCGSGLATLGIRPFVRRITGADSSRGMLDVLERKVRDQGLGNVSVQQIDLEERERLTGSYDLIISSMTMHHVSDVAELISRLVRLLNPGGWLALADLETEDGSFHEDLTGVRHHGFERDYLREICQASGLSHVRVVTATTVAKPASNGGSYVYPVILAVGQKAV